MEKKTFKNVTLYVSSDFGFGFKAIPCRELTVEIKPYAQHAQAVWLEWKEPRQKHARGTVKTPTSGKMPSVVVVDGLKNDKPPSMWGTSVLSTDGTTVTKGRYSACDPMWDVEFRNFIAGKAALFSTIEEAA